MLFGASILHRLAVSLVLLLGAAATGARADGPEPARAQTVAETPLGVGAIVLGILNYTAWPGEARSMTLCLTRGSADAAAILAQLEQARSARLWVARPVEPDATLPALCDAVYMDGWQVAIQRSTLRGLAAKPVLTLGRGPEFCSDGGLFCLEGSATGGLRFETNLDAVARSGLRINPLVLRLARPRPASSS